MRFSTRKAAGRSGGAAGSRTRRGLTTAVAACVAALGVAACGSSGGGSNTNNTSYGTVLYGTVPPAGTPVKGGTISVGQLTGSTETMIFPLTDCTHTTSYNAIFQSQMFVPLYEGPLGTRPEVNPQLSLADGPPVASNGGKTFTIHLKPGWKWSNGAPVTANDVLFFVDLLKAAVKANPANWCQYVPGQFPMSVTSMSAPNATTVVFNLNKAYNPGYFENNQLQDTNFGVFAIPSTFWNIAKTGGPHLDYTNPANALKIYRYLFAQGTDLATFASNPLWQDVDGPFKLKDLSTTNSSYDLVPNPSYSGSPKPQFSDLSVQTFTSWTAEENALRSGALDIGIQAEPDVVPQTAAFKRQGLYVFGGPGWGYTGTYINFDDKTGSFGAIMKQPYAVQVLYHLEDQPAIIRGIDKGAAIPQYGPIPSSPASPYTPTDSVKPLYPYDPAAAVALLKAHGWKVVPGGTSTCVKPGTAADECGAGVPAGATFGGVWLNLPDAVAHAAALASEAFISEAKAAAGINFTIKTLAFNQAQNYNDAIPQGKPLVNDWAMNNTASFSFDYYPTMEGVFNTGAPFNEGDYNNPTANQLMTNSVFSTDPKAVVTEASYLAKVPPILFFPGGDALSVVSKKVGGPANSFLALNEVFLEPQYWYLTK